MTLIGPTMGSTALVNAAKTLDPSTVDDYCPVNFANCDGCAVASCRSKADRIGASVHAPSLSRQ